MAKLYGFLALLAFSTSCYAETSSYSAPLADLLEKMQITILLEEFCENDWRKIDSGQNYTLTYKPDEKTEVRFWASPLPFLASGDREAYERFADSWEDMCFLNIGGVEFADGSAKAKATMLGVWRIPDDMVKDEFGADFADMVRVTNLKSGFSEGYDDALLVFFYNVNRGVVQVMILNNDGDALVTRQDFHKLFNCFAFRD